MATRTVAALFDDRTQAERAVQALLDSGYARSDISVTLRDRGETREFANDTGTKAAEGAGAGAVTGGVLGGLGGLLVGAGLLAIPGIGPILAAGQLAAVVGSTAAIAGATAAGAGIGAATGGLIGALVGMGVPNEEAHVYAEGVRRGGVLMLVNAEDESRYALAESILRQSGAVDVQSRRGEYERAGWTGFDASAPEWQDDYTGVGPDGRPGQTVAIDRTSDRMHVTDNPGGQMAAGERVSDLDSNSTRDLSSVRRDDLPASGTTEYVAGDGKSTTTGAWGASTTRIDRSDASLERDANWREPGDAGATDTALERDSRMGSGDVDDRGLRIQGGGDNRYGTEPITSGRENQGGSAAYAGNTMATPEANADLQGSRGDWAGGNDRDALHPSDGNTSVDKGDWERSSKLGTAGGGLAGAATGAAIGSAAGPVGTVVGGVAGAVAGAGAGGAADAAATEATDADHQRDTEYRSDRDRDGVGPAGGPTSSVLGGVPGTAHAVDRGDDARLRDEDLEEDDLDNRRM